MTDSTFGMIGDGFAILVADASSCRSILVYKQNHDKIMLLDSHKLLVGSGGQADSTNFAEYIQKNLKLYELNNDLKLSTHAAANFIRNELATALRKGPYQTNLLVAGFDESTGPSLYFMDYLAAMTKINFAAHGYASYFITSIFDHEWKPKMNLEDALILIKKCIHELHTRFLFSQPVFVIKLVDKNGSRVINLAGLLSEQGIYEEALPLSMQCLQLRKEVLGDRHPDTLTSMNNLAELYKNLKRSEEALPLFEQCLQLRKEVLGDRHPDTLTSMNNLAALYENQGRYEEALPLSIQCHRLCIEVLGVRDWDIRTSIRRLRKLYVNKGRYEEALPLYEQCLELHKEVLGARHPDTLTSMNDLARFYRDLKRYEEALLLYEQCLQLRKEVLGNRHPDTLITMNDLAGLYKNQGRYKEALPLYEQYLIVLGDRDPDTLITMNVLAGLYKNLKKNEEALLLCIQYLQLRIDVLKDGHPNTLTSMDDLDILTTLEDLAWLYKNQGRYEEALPLYEQCRQLNKEVLGDGHPRTLTINEIFELKEVCERLQKGMVVK